MDFRNRKLANKVRKGEFVSVNFGKYRSMILRVLDVKKVRGRDKYMVILQMNRYHKNKVVKVYRKYLSVVEELYFGQYLHYW